MMLNEIKTLKNGMDFMTQILMYSQLSEQHKTQLLNVYKKMSELLLAEHNFYLATRECNKLITRSGNKITITIPDIKKRNVNKETIAAYEFMLGMEKRYKTAIKKTKRKTGL